MYARAHTHTLHYTYTNTHTYTPVKQVLEGTKGKGAVPRWYLRVIEEAE